MCCDQLLIDCMSLNIRITRNVIAANFDELYYSVSVS
uniref:Uncharacterized protein n=1 Tax=Myoviridae sp. ctJ2i1 TaxID=2825079 RepID=A0A8S5V1Y5_9CAUD|nr:MAG TPA: hypothetical protein [Myoviridae sp. ctJ2i1]